MNGTDDIETGLAWRIGPDFVQWKAATIVRDYWPLFLVGFGIVGAIFWLKTRKG